jgi:TPR repeat protein
MIENQEKAEDIAAQIREVAEQGNAVAQVCLGNCYFEGKGVKQDYKEAIKWWEKAAEQGFAIAQVYLGHCYAKGDGVKQDYKEAIKWWKKAAEQGNSDAQTALINLNMP